MRAMGVPKADAGQASTSSTNSTITKPSIWQGNALYLLAITAFALGWHGLFGKAPPGALIDIGYTDTFTYMIRVTDTQWWSDRGQFAAYNAPWGTILHWTFPFPALLTALAAPLSLFLPWAEAVAIAGSLSSFLCMLVAAFGVYRLTRYMTTPGWAAISVIIAISCQVLFDYSQFGRPDHHMLALACVVWFWAALAAMEFGTHRQLAALGAGILAALAIWTTPETMAGLVAGLALQIWYRLTLNVTPGGEDSGQSTAWINDLCLTVAWLAAITLVLLIDPPFEGQWAPVYDRVSVVHLTFSACTGILLLARAPLLNQMQRRSRPFSHQLVATGLVGLAVIAAFLMAFPNAPAGALNQVSEPMTPWIKAIQEMQSVTRLQDLLINVSTPVIGLIALTLMLEVENRKTSSVGITPLKLQIIGAFSVCALIMVGAMLHYRFGYYAVAATAPFIFYLPKHLSEGEVTWLQPDKVVAALLALPLLTYAIDDLTRQTTEPVYNLFGRSNAEMALAANGQLAAHYQKLGKGRPNSPATFPLGQAACRNFPMVEQVAALMPKLQKASGHDQPLTGMFPQNPGPALAYRAGIRVVSAPYHRNEAGVLAAQSFYTAHDITGVPKMIIELRAIDLVGVCIKPVIDQPELERPGVYQWALNGGDEQFGPVLIIPGRWVILARQELLDSWAPVFFVDERDRIEDDIGNQDELN
ncbi:MAG: hypothetical protein AAF556_04530 [Pseudomonadota bacterium]